METLGIADEAVEAAARTYYNIGYRGSLDPTWDQLLNMPDGHVDFAIVRSKARKILEAALPHMVPPLKQEWGVRYDTHVDWIERPAAGEAWARVMHKENQDEGAIAVVRRQVGEWEVVDRG